MKTIFNSTKGYFHDLFKPKQFFSSPFKMFSKSKKSKKVV